MESSRREESGRYYYVLLAVGVLATLAAVAAAVLSSPPATDPGYDLALYLAAACFAYTTLTYRDVRGELRDIKQELSQITWRIVDSQLGSPSPAPPPGATES